MTWNPYSPVKLKEKFPDAVNPWRVLLKGPPKIVSEELVRFPTAHVPRYFIRGLESSTIIDRSGAEDILSH